MVFLTLPHRIKIQLAHPWRFRTIFHRRNDIIFLVDNLVDNYIIYYLSYCFYAYLSYIRRNRHERYSGCREVFYRGKPTAFAVVRRRDRFGISDRPLRPDQPTTEVGGPAGDCVVRAYDVGGPLAANPNENRRDRRERPASAGSLQRRTRRRPSDTGRVLSPVRIRTITAMASLRT